MSTKVKPVESHEEAWETGELGRSLEHAQIVNDKADEGIDAALHLQPISIRLEKSLIDAFKFIASYHKGIGYQPLMRQILHRFAASELNRIAQEMEGKTKGVSDVNSPPIISGDPPQKAA